MRKIFILICLSICANTSWQKFTDKFISEIHSITVADVDGKTMTIKQLDIDGKVLDSFKVTK